MTPMMNIAAKEATTTFQPTDSAPMASAEEGSSAAIAAANPQVK